MPTKRTRRIRGIEELITPAAVAAFKAGDYLALHRALRLRPWEASPLPRETEALGVDDGPCQWGPNTLYGESWPRAQELQRRLMTAAGLERRADSDNDIT